MFNTTLQFDVLFRLKELTGNYELTFEDFGYREKS